MEVFGDIQNLYTYLTVTFRYLHSGDPLYANLCSKNPLYKLDVIFKFFSSFSTQTASRWRLKKILIETS